MTPLSIGAIVAAVAFALGASSGCKLTADHYKAAQLKQERATAAAFEQRTNELNQVSAELERARHDRKVVYRTITQRVENVVARDVYRNVCLDADGVLLVNSAFAGKPIDSSQLDAAVPIAGAAAGDDGR